MHSKVWWKYLHLSDSKSLFVKWVCKLNIHVHTHTHQWKDTWWAKVVILKVKSCLFFLKDGNLQHRKPTEDCIKPEEEISRRINTYCKDSEVFTRQCNLKIKKTLTMHMLHVEKWLLRKWHFLCQSALYFVLWLFAKKKNNSQKKREPFFPMKIHIKVNCRY